MKLHPMTEADLSVIDLIERQIYEFPWSIRNFQDSIRAGYDAYCLWEDYSMTGYIVMMKVVDEMHLLNLSVRGDLQGKGLGRKLLRWGLKHSLSKQTNGMLLEVRPSNEPAKQLYESEGFKLVGVRKNYYPAKEGREDALVLFKPFFGQEKVE